MRYFSYEERNITHAASERSRVRVSSGPPQKEKGLSQKRQPLSRMFQGAYYTSFLGGNGRIALGWFQAGRKILCKQFSTKSRMALESRADSGLNPLITESHGGQNGMRAGTA